MIKSVDIRLHTEGYGDFLVRSGWHGVIYESIPVCSGASECLFLRHLYQYELTWQVHSVCLDNFPSERAKRTPYWAVISEITNVELRHIVNKSFSWLKENWLIVFCKANEVRKFAGSSFSNVRHYKEGNKLQNSMLRYDTLRSYWSLPTPKGRIWLLGC